MGSRRRKMFFGVIYYLAPRDTCLSAASWVTAAHAAMASVTRESVY